MQATWWWPGPDLLGPSVVLLAGGRLQVAHQPERAERILSSGCRPLTRFSVTDPRRLRVLLAQARDTGFAEEDEQAMLGWSCMAAVVRDQAGTMIGAIGVTGRSSGIAARGLRSGLLRSAGTLAGELRAAALRDDGHVWETPVFDGRTGIGYVWPAPGTATGH